MAEKGSADFIEENRKAAQKIIKLYMKELARPERLETTATNHLASALATLIDKFGSQKDIDERGTLIVTHQIPRAEEEK